MHIDGSASRFIFLAAALIPLGLPRPLSAQCPDGSAPPCRKAAAPAPPANSVAVLYLDNLSRDTANAFLADGLTEEIIIRLAQVQRLEVKSRFEVQRFRGRTAQDPQTLGRSLNAAYLLSGSVERGGDHVRLRVALVRSANRAQVWANIIDRSSNDFLTIESEIAREVVLGVTGQLLPQERVRLSRPLTTDPVAYEEYLRGLRDLNTSYQAGPLYGAIAHFERAIERDSGFAAAFAGKAGAWGGLADGYLPPRAGYGSMREAARTALVLDSSLAGAYVMLAEATRALDLDARESLRLTRRALELDPRSSDAHAELSEILMSTGPFDQGVEEARRAWELDSLQSFKAAWYMHALLTSHRVDSAAALLLRLRASLPPAEVAPIEARVLAERGDLKRAEPLLDWRYYGGINAATYVRALLARGDSAGARATVDSMLAARTPGYYNPLSLARAYAALGDIDHGIEWLQRAFDERTIWVWEVPVDDEIAPLRKDPRFAPIVQQLRF